MSIVVPGQYLVPEYENSDDKEEAVARYIPGAGSALTKINCDGTSISVVVATVLGKKIIQEISEKMADNVEEEQNGEAKEPQKADEQNIKKTYLVSVISGKQNEYREYASKIDTSASASVDATATNLPREGDVVLVRITRLVVKQAFCEVLCVYGAGNVCADGGQGSTGTTAHLSIPMGGGSQILSSYGAVAASQSTMSGSQPLDIGESFKAIIRSQDVRSTDRDKVKIEDCFRPGDIVRARVLSLGDGSNYYLTTARNDLGVVFAKSEGGAGDPMMAVDWETMVCEKTGVVEKRKCAKLF